MEEQNLFRTTFRGYRKAQVNEYLSQMRQDFEAKKEELATKMRELAAQNESLAARLTELTAQLTKYQGQEQIIAQILVEAQVRAVAIEREAKQKAESIEQQITTDIAMKRTELSNIRARIEEFKKDFIRMLDNYRASLPAIDELASGSDSFFSGSGVKSGGV